MTETDPRLSIIDERLGEIKKIISVASGKGGVGKSLVSSTLALTLSRKGYRVGLLDLDFHGPSAHTILGVGEIQPEEDKGVLPPETHGIKLMSIVYYIGENPSFLRGQDISNAIIELLAITRWGSLDFLVIDMPPGTGDEILDVIRLMKKSKFLVVTTPSKVVWGVVSRLVKSLKELKIPTAGLLENMKTPDYSFIREKADELEVSYLGELSYDYKLEDAIGNADKLIETTFAKDLEKILNRFI